MKTAKLIPTMIEIPEKNYKWVPAYKVITPEGNELQPYFRAKSTKYYQSAASFCKEKGWKYEIELVNR